MTPRVKNPPTYFDESELPYDGELISIYFELRSGKKLWWPATVESCEVSTDEEDCLRTQ